MRKVGLAIALVMICNLAQAQHHSSTGNHSNSKSSSSKKKKRHVDEGRKFNFSLGLTYTLSNSKTKSYTDGGGTLSLTRQALATGIFAYPKYSFIVNDKYSLSLGIPLSLAFEASASTDGESSSSFMYDLPIMLDINGGCMNPRKRFEQGRFGYFAGAGIGIQNGDASLYSSTNTGYSGTYPNATVKSAGPCVHVGGVFRFGREERPHFVGARVAYKFGINSDNFNYTSVSIFLNI